MMDKLSNYIIVDIGANLTNKKFSRDLDAVIQRAREAGVTKIMVRTFPTRPGVDRDKPKVWYWVTT